MKNKNIKKNVLINIFYKFFGLTYQTQKKGGKNRERGKNGKILKTKVEKEMGSRLYFERQYWDFERRIPCASSCRGLDRQII